MSTAAVGQKRRATPGVVTRLDEALFEPHRWFAIDASNTRVPRVIVPTLTVGLSLIGDGDVATIVGRLRHRFLVVDIDIDGIGGEAVTEAIATWCRRHDLWHLIRPSGGIDGRAHVFLAPGPRTEALSSYLDQLRSAYNVPQNRIDLRRDIRPLSAPHRNGTNPRPAGPLGPLLRHARTLISADTAPRATTGRPRRHACTTAKTPRPRKPRSLPAPWATYLRTGVAPPVGGQDTSRSTIEAITTAHLLRAGASAESAWTEILNSHPTAMTRAKASRRRWTAWVWNRAVDDDLQRPPDVCTSSPGVRAAIAAARQHLHKLQFGFTPRQRPALLLVGHHVLDRMERTNQLRVPVPERDLVLDTGLTDRKTIRGALRSLNGLLGTLHTKTWDPTRRDSSSFEFEIESGASELLGGLSLLPPPSNHTPLPRGLWSVLPRAAHALYRGLVLLGKADLGALARYAGLTSTADGDLSAAQVRTCRSALAALIRGGLATCDGGGIWTVAPGAESVNGELAAVGARLHDRVSRDVESERMQYRLGRESDWQKARRAALAKNRDRERGWWHALPEVERAARHAHWQSYFAQLSVLEQQSVKSELARRRQRAGVDEAGRHASWIGGLEEGTLDRRSIERQAWFSSLAKPLQQAYVWAWSEHRRVFGIHRLAGGGHRPASQEATRRPRDVDRERSLFDGSKWLGEKQISVGA